MHNEQDIRTAVKAYITEHFVRSRNIGELADTTSLLSSGIMDSISTMQLITFLEHTFHIEFEAHEIDREHFETIERIAQFVKTKL